MIPAGAFAAETPEQMIAAAKALDAAFFKAFNAGDAEGVAATYWRSPDVVSFPPDTMELRGWDAIKAAFPATFQAMAGAKLELLDSHYMVAGEFVITWGKWRMTMPGPDGKPMSTEGRYTDVKAKRDGKWVYIHDHASAPMGPPPG
jgi:uncharacterized protein (TIGR02246 family)